MRSQVANARAILYGLSMIVLLVVGLNISGMMLAPARFARAMAIRSAMGASRWRLMRHHLTEALVLALFGGALPRPSSSSGRWRWHGVRPWGPWLDLFRPDVGIILQCLGLCFVTSLVLGCCRRSASAARP